jgi:hypothetical protein
MNNVFRTSLLAAACALGLAACDVSVRDEASASAPQASGHVTQAEPAAPAADTSTATLPSADTTAATPAASDPGAASSSSSSSSSDIAAVSPAAPLPSGTSVMGAPGGAPATAMPPTTSDGAAAPTELSQFLDASEQRAAAKASEPAKAEAKK